MKQRNPRFGCPRIAQQINKAFGTNIHKDVVRRVLATYYKSSPSDSGPSWLTFIGNTKHSLWSIDLFRCESILLNSHWVLVVMDQFTRRIIGFGIHAGNVDGIALCRMFNTAISPLRRTADRDHSPRIPRPHLILERYRPGKKVGNIPAVLQHSPCALFT